MKGSKMMNYVGAIAWAVVFGVRLRGVFRGDWLASLLAMQAGIVVWRVLFRREPIVEAEWHWRVFAWASALLPLAVLSGGVRFAPEAMAVPVGVGGIALSLLALLWLGGSFGIAPSDRGLVTGGPYRFLRHPAYAAELISLLSYISLNLNSWNVIAAALVAISITFRIQMEERLVAGYEGYATIVRWRVLPGIW